MKFEICTAALVLASSAFSQTLDGSLDSHEISGFFGKSALMLGSGDIRIGGGLSYSYGRYEPRFSFHGVSAQIVYEGYLDRTYGTGNNGPKNVSDAAGFLFYGRWFAHIHASRYRPYYDLGWGFQYADAPTRDLPSEINSTPFTDLGIAIPAGKQDLFVGFRYLHISNAGFVTPNRGQNQIFLTVGVAF